MEVVGVKSTATTYFSLPPNMTFSILPPAPADAEYLSESPDDGSLDSEGDVDMIDTIRPSKRAKHSHSTIITPGETITDDPQWMR